LEISGEEFEDGRKPQETANIRVNSQCCHGHSEINTNENFTKFYILDRMSV